MFGLFGILLRSNLNWFIPVFINVVKYLYTSFDWFDLIPQERASEAKM